MTTSEAKPQTMPVWKFILMLWVIATVLSVGLWAAYPHLPMENFIGTRETLAIFGALVITDGLAVVMAVLGKAPLKYINLITGFFVFYCLGLPFLMTHFLGS